jgi:hypothetical protein
MNVNKDEEIIGSWATPPVPGTGVYKLVAKKRTDGVVEWAHFIHRADGTRHVVFRGEVESRARLADVLNAANKHLKGIFGVIMAPADLPMRTLDGRSNDGKVH